jgi:hypothetical protein
MTCNVRGFGVNTEPDVEIISDNSIIVNVKNDIVNDVAGMNVPVMSIYVFA